MLNLSNDFREKLDALSEDKQGRFWAAFGRVYLTHLLHFEKPDGTEPYESITPTFDSLCVLCSKSATRNAPNPPPIMLQKRHL